MNHLHAVNRRRLLCSFSLLMFFSFLWLLDFVEITVFRCDFAVNEKSEYRREVLFTEERRIKFSAHCTKQNTLTSNLFAFSLWVSEGLYN